MTNRRTVLSFSALAIFYMLPCEVAWGALTACSGTYTLAATGLLSGGTALTGCEQVDLNFNNFTYGIAKSGGPTVDYLPVAFSGAAVPGTIASTFGTSGVVNWAEQLGPGGVIESVQTNTVAIDSSMSNGSSITQLALSVGTGSLQGSSSTASFIAVVQQFCTGTSSFNCTSSSANFGIIEYVLNATTSGGTSIYSRSCYGGGAVCQQLATNQAGAGTGGITLTDLNLGTAGLTLNLPSTTTLTAENIVEIHNDGDAYLDNLTNDWVETTPEPSTLTLLGTALTVLGALAWKRNRASVKAPNHVAGK